MTKSENKNTEYKELMRDEYLKTIYAFAKTNCGTLYISRNENRKVVGVAAEKNCSCLRHWNTQI